MIKKTVLERNRDYSEKFIQPVGNEILPDYVKTIVESENPQNLIDLGCGDGIFINAIKKFFPSIKITGIDISPRRINSLKRKFPLEEFFVKDVCKTGVNKKFDFVHSSQVIEHVEDDKEMVKEMARIMSPEGRILVSSVMKTGPMIYKYRNKGKFVLDPTHEREYKNEKEFLDLFKEDFKLIKVWKEPVKRRILRLMIPIPNYYLIYGVWRKR